MLLALTATSAVCAAVPALLTVWNGFEYVAPPAAAAGLPQVTVIVPARNEAAGIVACMQSVLASRGVDLRLVVVDDASTDGTAELVSALAGHDGRVQLLQSASLPAGWNGKQHACWQGAQAVQAQVLCFLDADVRLQPDALARTATLLVRDQAALVSGFPLEVTGTLLEKLLIPLIHFVLLGMLPMRFLRTGTSPGFAAGCGQFLMVQRAAYLQSGGHAAIRHTMHDGLLLPRLLRRHGFATRLADITHLATCRMYRTAGEVWKGLAKNATEGLAAPARIVPLSAFLLMGQVAPLVLLLVAAARLRYIFPFLGPPLRVGMPAVWCAAAALVLSYLPRAINAVRYRQSWLSVALHPAGAATLLVLQWYALVQKLRGRSATWKQRTYSAN